MFVEELTSGRWRGGFRMPPGGRKSRKVTRTFDTSWEAEAWAMTEERKVYDLAHMPALPTAAEALDARQVEAPEAAPLLVGQAPTLAAHVKDWLARNAHLAKSTLDGYGTHSRALLASADLMHGARPMDELTRGDVQRWRVATLAESNPPTVNARHKVLRMVYADAMVEHPLLVRANPAAALKYLPTDKGPDRTLTPAEVGNLLAACEADPKLAPLKLAVLLGVDAGLRYQEAYGLPVAGVRGEFVEVFQVVERSRGKLRAYPKGHRTRTVPVTTDRLADALDVAARSARARAGSTALLMTNRDGGPFDYHGQRRQLWVPALAAAELADAPGFHSLRHTYGSDLAAAGVPRAEIARLMGHADESTTARYIHEGDDGRRRDLVRAALAKRAVA